MLRLYVQQAQLTVIQGLWQDVDRSASDPDQAVEMLYAGFSEVLGENGHDLVEALSRYPKITLHAAEGTDLPVPTPCIMEINEDGQFGAIIWPQPP